MQLAPKQNKSESSDMITAIYNQQNNTEFCTIPVFSKAASKPSAFDWALWIGKPKVAHNRIIFLLYRYENG